MKKGSRITLLIILAPLLLFAGLFTLYVISASGFGYVPALERALTQLLPPIFFLLALFYYIKLILVAKNSGQTGQIISRGKEIRDYVICFVLTLSPFLFILVGEFFAIYV